jgi:hypothetical protein
MSDEALRAKPRLCASAGGFSPRILYTFESVVPEGVPCDGAVGCPTHLEQCVGQIQRCGYDGCYASISSRAFATEERMSPETKSDLEHDLSSAVHMAHVAVNLVEKALRAAQENATGRPDTYHVNVKDVEALVQALFETRDQIRAARDRLQTLTDAPR